MSSLFQALKNAIFKKKSRSKSSRRHRSKSKINDSKKKDILETKHQKLTYNSSSSSISIKKQDHVDRIIGKACVEPSLDECFIIYLIKWKNKTLKESTWQHSRKLTIANQKIRWFNQNINPIYLPNFHQQYKDKVPNYRQILENSIKTLSQTKKESKYNRQSKKKKDKTFKKKDSSDSDQIPSSKTKKIKKEGQNKHKRQKQQRFQSPQRKKKSSHKTSKKHRKQKNKKDLLWERSDKSDKHKKQYHESKKQVKENYKDEESFHRKLDKTLEEYFKSGKNNIKGTPDQKIPQLLNQSDKVSVSTVFLENSVCQKFDDLSATEKSTNQDVETVEDFIFLSDTYKDQDFKIKLQEKLSRAQLENAKSHVIQDIEFVSIQKDLQRGEVTIDEQSFLYSRLIELEEGQFNDDDYTGLIRFCG